MILAEDDHTALSIWKQKLSLTGKDESHVSASLKQHSNGNINIFFTLIYSLFDKD